MLLMLVDCYPHIMLCLTTIFVASQDLIVVNDDDRAGAYIVIGVIRTHNQPRAMRAPFCNMSLLSEIGTWNSVSLGIKVSVTPLHVHKADSV